EAAGVAEGEGLWGVKLTGGFLGTKLGLPALREAAQQSPHGSAIVNLASTAGLVGSAQDPLYLMTKGGVTLFTKSAALEFARKGYRIRVNSIHQVSFRPIWVSRLSSVAPAISARTTSMRRDKSHCRLIQLAGWAYPATSRRASFFSLRTMPGS